MAFPTRHFKIRFNARDIYWNVIAYQEQGRREQYEISMLFNFVVKGMQFSCDYCVDDDCGILAVDENAVEQLPNGTWTGVVGLLNRSEIDYAPAALMLTEESWDAAAYNYPYMNDELVFVTKKPEYSPETMALFRTLSSNVWLSLLACIVLVTLACFVAMKKRCTLEDILLHVLAIALNQEGNLVPKMAGEVLLLCTWTVAMAVFTFCFKSVLLSFLSFPPLGGVRTVPELAAAIRAGHYIACPVSISLSTSESIDFARYLQRSPVDDFRVIGESILKNVDCDMSDWDKSPEYPMKAFVHRRSYLATMEGDYFYVSKDNMGSLYFATAVSRDFCCKDEMDMLVHRFVAAGIMPKLQSFRYLLYDYFESEYFKDGEERIRKITMTDLAGAFILLVSGHCLSVFALIIECCLKPRERRHSSKRNKQSGAV